MKLILIINTDVTKNIFDKYRKLAKKYNLTFLLIHHLNKESKTLCCIK